MTVPLPPQDAGTWTVPTPGRRVAARFIDAGYGIGVFLVWVGLTSVAGGGAAMLYVGYLAIGLANVGVELRFSATPGQLTLGLHNVQVENGMPSGPRTVAKYFLMGIVSSVTCGIALVVALLTLQPPLNRSWFDRWTGMVVVPRGSVNQGMALPSLMSSYVPVASAGPPPVAGSAGAPAWAVQPPAPIAHTSVPAPVVPEPVVPRLPADPTVVGPAPVPVPVPVVPVPGSVVLADGQVLRLDRPYVLGRDPVAPPTVPAAAPIRVVDVALSVSKTHLLVRPAADGAEITDLNSTNGVSLTRPGGAAERLAPGVPATAPVGTRVTFGQSNLEVRR